MVEPAELGCPGAWRRRPHPADACPGSKRAHVFPGLGLGLVGAFAGTHLIEQLLFDVTPTDATAFATATVCLAAVALVASAWPAWRAARINPVQALRGE